MRRISMILAAMMLYGAARFFQRNKGSPATRRKPSHDEIASSAYFIGLERGANGQESRPLQDWIEAERQLCIKPS